jgi:hypothetical protein
MMGEPTSRVGEGASPEWVIFGTPVSRGGRTPEKPLKAKFRERAFYELG